MSDRDPQINPQAGDIVRSVIYKNRPERHVTGRIFDDVSYEAVSPTMRQLRKCDVRTWQRWCAYNKVEIVIR